MTFDEFKGMDIERLNDCLKSVYASGLKIDKYTQAGVNQSSGNVWVWSEDWAGAVACSIGFDVFWVHSCSECGSEHEFETYAELEEYVNKYHVASCEECHVEDEVNA